MYLLLSIHACGILLLTQARSKMPCIYTSIMALAYWWGVLGVLHDVLGFITDASAFAAVTIAPLKLVSSFVFVCPVISGILAESECIPD